MSLSSTEAHVWESVSERRRLSQQEEREKRGGGGGRVGTVASEEESFPDKYLPDTSLPYILCSSPALEEDSSPQSRRPDWCRLPAYHKHHSLCHSPPRGKHLPPATAQT